MENKELAAATASMSEEVRFAGTLQRRVVEINSTSSYCTVQDASATMKEHKC
jgi:hypothetical protein